MVFREIKTPVESVTRTRIAKELYAKRLKEEKEELPDADDSSLKKADNVSISGTCFSK